MPVHPRLKNYAAQLGFPQSETLARIFAILYPDEDTVKVVAALPGTVADLSAKTGLAQARVQEIIAALLRKGAIGHPMHQPQFFRRFPAMIELRDSSVLNPDCPEELFALWEKLIREETAGLVPLIKQLKVPPMVRVVPIEKTVEAQNTVLDIDSARKVFQDAELISVIPCACRLQARKNGRGQDCPAPESSVCMQTHGFAEAVLARGIGQRITPQDALRRLGEAEDAGLVHMVRNNVKRDMFMCNCCSCCCTGLYFVNQLGYPQAVAPSRFRVRYNPDTCSGCGECEERCQFHALKVEDSDVAIDYARCYGCGNCALTCPEQALVLEEVRPREHIRIK